MNKNDLERVLLAFADDASNLDLSKGDLIMQVRDELIEASVEESRGTLYVTEAGNRSTAYRWLVDRIARIALLSERILTHVAAESCFVTPSGMLTDYLHADPEEQRTRVDDVPAKLPELLSRKKVSASSVLYVTSEAGEGKTTLINELARRQAARYKAGKAQWLLVPISLGGRAFMTFSDVVVAELVNKLRFHLFHYGAFLEMVRLGVLVPAFDGFEEMFVAGSSGEVTSALGNLITDLDSSGAVLVAARMVYFDDRNLKLQAKLFDTVKDGSVDFAQLDLRRWDQPQFLDYARKRGVPNGVEIYDQVRHCLGRQDHPLLTRAVLAARLLDMAADYGVDSVIERLRTDRDDYFHQFIHTIVEREANRKWVDQKTPHQPLITGAEHHDLLAEVAKEMWINASDSLPGDYLDLVADLYADNLDKPPPVKSQIVQRVRQHALISKTAGSDIYTFSHDDFRRYYLGVALARLLASSKSHVVIRFLGEAILPTIAVHAALDTVKRDRGDLMEILCRLQSFAHQAASVSYAADNIGALAVRLLELLNLGGNTGETVEVDTFTFPLDALKGRRYGRVTFTNCRFQSTILDDALLGECRFSKCTMYELRWSAGFDAGGAVVDGCKVHRVVTPAGPVYDPDGIRNALVSAGFEVANREPGTVAAPPAQPDEETAIAERALRGFMRSTQINENTFRQRLGSKAGVFFATVLPKMLDRHVVEEVQYLGRGTQRRYQLRVPISSIETVIPIPQGVRSLDQFLHSLANDQEE